MLFCIKKSQQRSRKKILDGSYPLGENIPSEPELEKLFGVSKMTIRQAVALLAAEGYVDKQRGRGTQVISNQLFNKLSKAKSFFKKSSKNLVFRLKRKFFRLKL
ncbi:GntR family transcriptional regulator [Listeria aquatica]|uniref:GntR family transcriptional regulator n=1 Tax=Listeria aquatica FSL S10-1188 TaxID=1265818 RepID=W7B2X5_9LIST|nr:GntR family transcriptional regulator [Listeria aquatica]EUJ21589.1 GntR family transcriptional regulator [Listeria aquatica FSL S10-1188]